MGIHLFQYSSLFLAPPLTPGPSLLPLPSPWSLLCPLTPSPSTFTPYPAPSLAITVRVVLPGHSFVHRPLPPVHSLPPQHHHSLEQHGSSSPVTPLSSGPFPQYVHSLPSTITC